MSRGSYVNNGFSTSQHRTINQTIKIRMLGGLSSGTTARSAGNSQLMSSK